MQQSPTLYTTNFVEWVEPVTQSWQFTATVDDSAAAAAATGAIGWIALAAALRRVVALNYDSIAASSVIVPRHVASRCVVAFPPIVVTSESGFQIRYPDLLCLFM